MRLSIFLSLLLPAFAWAQPGPPSFCFVLAEDRAAMRSLEREVRIVQRFRERVPYVGYSGTWLGPEQELPLQGGPLFRDSTEHWVRYNPVEGMAESHLLVTSGADTMRIELPEDETLLWQQAMARGSVRDTPEVIRFRSGTFRMEDLVVDSWSVRAAQRLNERAMAEDRAAYKRELAEQAEYYKHQPPPPEKAPVKSPYVPPTPAQLDSIRAALGGLEKVELAQSHYHMGEEVTVIITGNVMLTGGCASAMPMFGVQRFFPDGSVEIVPMPTEQMDCGMPWIVWKDHPVSIDLAWWIRTNAHEGIREMQPGTYFLEFRGADGKEMFTGALEITE